MIRLLPFALVLCALTACSDTGVRKFGTGVARSADVRATPPPPLSAPPSLRDQPERVGAAPDDVEAPPYGALPPDAAPGRLSAGQSAIIGAAGPSAPADIRKRVDQDQQVRSQRSGFADELLARPPGTSSDVQGSIIQSGDGKSWLDRIF